MDFDKFDQKRLRELVKRFHKLHTKTHSHRIAYLQSHPTLVRDDDPRSTVLGMWSHVLRATQLGIVFMEKGSVHDKWWEEVVDPKTVPPSKQTIDELNNEYFMLVKIGLITGAQMTVEYSFRLFLRALDSAACSGGRADFENIASALLKRLNLTHKASVIKALRSIRNTLHNNGLYFPKKPGNTSITIGSETIELKDGQPIMFGWDTLLILVEEVQQLLFDVIDSPELSSIPAVSNSLL